MKAVIQTVFDASIIVNEEIISHIDRGMLVYFGVEKDDQIEMVLPFIEKMLKLRIFKDENGKTNLDLEKSNSSMLFISQFTLAANVYRGNRPSFDSAKKGEEALAFYNLAVKILKEKGINVQCGAFGEYMLVSYVNDGPETFILESDKILKKV